MPVQGVIEKYKRVLQKWLSSNPGYLMDVLQSKGIITWNVYRRASDIIYRDRRITYLLDEVIDTDKQREMVEALNEVKEDYPQLTAWPPLYYRSLTIDINSVNAWLECGANRRTLTATKRHQCYPEHAERFCEWKVALCSESFSSGCHYWEVCVEKAKIYRVGIAYASLPRGGSEYHTWLGRSKKSWCLCRRDDGYFVAHDGNEKKLSDIKELKYKIGVLLDMDEGSLSFYGDSSYGDTYCGDTYCGDTRHQPLHKFDIERFEGVVHPALMVGRGSLEIVKW